MSPRMTQTTRLVLGSLLAGGEMYGREVCLDTGLAAGTIYPILARLERYDYLKGHNEVVNPHKEGRPPRRYYRLTPLGADKARAVGLVRPPEGIAN